MKTLIGLAVGMLMLVFSLPAGAGKKIVPECEGRFEPSGQETACAAVIDLMTNDACLGEEGMRTWWTCEMDHAGITCPSKSKLKFGGTSYKCIFGKPQKKGFVFQCADGFQLNLGELCGPAGTYCCLAEGLPNVCGDQAEFEASSADGACCVVWKTGTC